MNTSAMTNKLCINPFVNTGSNDRQVFPALLQPPSPS